jgi:hypothetical protein
MASSEILRIDPPTILAKVFRKSTDTIKGEAIERRTESNTLRHGKRKYNAHGNSGKLCLEHDRDITFTQGRCIMKTALYSSV